MKKHKGSKYPEDAAKTASSENTADRRGGETVRPGAKPAATVQNRRYQPSAKKAAAKETVSQPKTKAAVTGGKPSADKPAPQKPMEKRVWKAPADKPAAKTQADKSAAKTQTDKSAAKTQADKPSAKTQTDKPAAKTQADKPSAKTQADKPAAKTQADKPSAKTQTDKSAAKAQADKTSPKNTAEKNASKAAADKPAPKKTAGGKSAKKTKADAHGYQQVQKFNAKPDNQTQPEKKTKVDPIPTEPVPKKKKEAAEPFPWWKIIVAVAVVALAAAFLFVLRVAKVRVEGNEQYSAEYIWQLSGISAGEHLLFCREDKVRQGIQSNPYLRLKEFRRQFPDEIVIVVEERKEAAVIHGLDYDVIIDKTGYVLAFGNSSMDYSDLVEITGISAAGFQVNKPIGESDDFQVQALLALLDSLESCSLTREIAAIDLSNPLSVNMKTKFGVTVHVGEVRDLEGKMEWIRDVLPELKKRGITSGTLDVSSRGAIYSPVHERVLPEPEPEPTQEGEEDLLTDPAEESLPEGTEESMPEESVPEEEPSPTEEP